MHLRAGGIDIFYIDESHDANIYVATAVCVPFLRNIEGQWTFVWQNHFQASKRWRQQIRDTQKIPVYKELHAVKLVSGRGKYLKGKFQFPPAKAPAVYRRILEAINFLPEASIMSAAAVRGPTHLFGNVRLEAAMHALFQRMRRKCIAHNVNAITFFDQGHPEYRKLYRQSQIYLPTGQHYGGGTRNLPLDMFTKDANWKDSKHCWFTQTADLIAYAAFLKIKHERNELADWQSRYNLGNAYDSIPKRLLNTRASLSAPRDAIVRL